MSEQRSDNVVQLVPHTLHDIPACMEAMAQNIRNGDIGPVTAGVAVFFGEDGTPTVCGWGQTDPVHSIGLLGIGAAWLQNHVVKR